jgi:hypothetical protein
LLNNIKEFLEINLPNSAKEMLVNVFSFPSAHTYLPRSAEQMLNCRPLPSIPKLTGDRVEARVTMCKNASETQIRAKLFNIVFLHLLNKELCRWQFPEEKTYVV